MDQFLENLKKIRKMKIGFAYNHLCAHMEFSNIKNIGLKIVGMLAYT